MLNEDIAQSLLLAAREKAEALGVRVNIAVVDAGAHLLAFKRMDQAMLGSIDVAIKKARTAVLFPLPTEAFGAVISSEQLLGMDNTNGGLVAFAGGLPLLHNGTLVGGIGISGATAEQDKEIAEYALANAVG